MIKKSNTDFSTPAHQPLYSIVVIFWKSFGGIIRGFWPLLFIFFMNRKQNSNWLLIIGSVGLALISFVFGILRYYNFLYHIEDKNLVISSGLFTKVTKNIPFDRIQSIRLEQKAVHRMLNLYSVRIDTAGSANEEIEIPALEHVTASKIKEYIVQYNRSTTSSKTTVNPIDQADQEELVFKLSLWDIIKLGLTANHIRNFFIIVGVLIGISTQLGELDDKYRLDKWVTYAIDSGKELGFRWEFLLIIPAAILISMIVSLGMSLLKNYNLQVRKSPTGYRVNQGLINRNEQFAPYKKIQIFKWSISPLRRLLGLYHVNIKQASSVEMSAKKSINIPGAHIGQVSDFLSRVFYKSDREGKSTFQVHIKFLYRYFIFLVVIPAIAFCILYYFFPSIQFMLLTFLWIIFGTLALVRYFDSWEIWLGESYLQLGRGILTMSRERIFLHKLQGVRIHQTPYQSRHDLASVSVYTAAGTLTIPYITLSDANQMANYFLYKVESSRKAWM